MRFHPLSYLALLLIISVAFTQEEEVSQKKRKPALFTSDSYSSPENDPTKYKLSDFPEKFQVKGFTPDNQDTWTGYINVRANNNSKLWYMMHAPTNKTVDNKDPIIFWLQGGPGCSSVFGNVNEIGPIEITSFDNTTGKSTYGPRRTTWGDTNNLVFIDSPIGVGFSPADPKDLVSDTATAAKDLHTFIVQFFKVHPTLATNPVYVFGESYGGHYVPAFTYEIFNNRNWTHINLVGMGIGDGLIDPINQFPFYSLYAYAAGLVSTIGHATISGYENQLYQAIKRGDWGTASDRFENCTDYIQNIQKDMNIYNFRQYKVSPDGFTPKWANHSVTQRQLGVPEGWNYDSCNEAIYHRFREDIPKSLAPQVQEMTGHIDTLIYNGQDDVIINTPGQNNWLMQLGFHQSQDIRNVQKKLFKLDKQIVGQVQGKGGFYYVVVNKAGHMVPQDQGDSCRAMLKHFQNRDDTWTS